MLEEHPDARVRVFAVWEPILPTDWSKPMSFVLNRISDHRVTQFWDHDHVLATQMAKDARDPQPTQRCCVQNGHLWDLAAVYPLSTTWDAAMPTAFVFDGPVVNVRDRLLELLSSKDYH